MLNKILKISLVIIGLSANGSTFNSISYLNPDADEPLTSMPAPLPDGDKLITYCRARYPITLSPILETDELEDDEWTSPRLDSLLEKHAIDTFIALAARDQDILLHNLAFEAGTHYSPLFYKHPKFRELLNNLEAIMDSATPPNNTLATTCKTLYNFFAKLMDHDFKNRSIYGEIAQKYWEQYIVFSDNEAGNISDIDFTDGPIKPVALRDIRFSAAAYSAVLGFERPPSRKFH